MNRQEFPVDCQTWSGRKAKREMILCSAIDRGVGLCYCPGIRVILGRPLAPSKMINLGSWRIISALTLYHAQSTWTQIHFNLIVSASTVEQPVTEWTHVPSFPRLTKTRDSVTKYRPVVLPAVRHM